MAKRYHQSKKDRMHERHGMEHHVEKMAEKRHMSGHSPIFHEKDMHNDEYRHDRAPERFGAYPYDRQHEYRMGKSVSEGFYAGAEPRRRQEMRDAGMIHEDHSAIANLPQYVKIEAYPKDRDYLPEGLDDSLRGVDQQMAYDNHKRSQHFFPKKV